MARDKEPHICIVCGGLRARTLIDGGDWAHARCITKDPPMVDHKASAETRIRQNTRMIQIHEEVLQQMRGQIALLEHMLHVNPMVTLRREDALRRRKAGG